MIPIVVGAVAGGVAGAAVLCVFIGLGFLLMSRVSSPIPVIVLAVAGAYAAWLLGVVVFGAVRGAGDTEKQA
ncbi:MAG TPA: hypothetical protein VNF26_09255 [Candidatus Baltobacterales bacterium]|nr:hypothetical protein [Candidatus Baltobacterales bacterium]